MVDNISININSFPNYKNCEEECAVNRRIPLPNFTEDSNRSIDNTITIISKFEADFSISPYHSQEPQCSLN